MRTASHLDKFDRLSALRRRLDPLEDFELWYWTTLTAGTTAYNACLHLTGVTEDEPIFSTIPGVHLVPQADGTYARQLRGPGDVSHVGWPAIPGDLPRAVRDVEAAMHALEEYRDQCLRGEREPDATIVARCEAGFEVVARTLAGLTAGAKT